MGANTIRYRVILSAQYVAANCNVGLSVFRIGLRRLTYPLGVSGTAAHIRPCCCLVRPSVEQVRPKRTCRDSQKPRRWQVCTSNGLTLELVMWPIRTIEFSHIERVIATGNRRI